MPIFRLVALKPLNALVDRNKVLRAHSLRHLWNASLAPPSTKLLPCRGGRCHRAYSDALRVFDFRFARDVSQGTLILFALGEAAPFDRQVRWLLSRIEHTNQIIGQVFHFFPKEIILAIIKLIN